MERLERLLKKGFEFYGTARVASSRDMKLRRMMKSEGYRIDPEFEHMTVPTRAELRDRLLSEGYDDVVFMPPSEGNRHQNVDVYCLSIHYAESTAAG